MHISRKLFIFVGASFVTLLLLFILLFNIFIVSNFNKVESEYAIRTANHISFAVTEIGDSLEKTASDWGFWDEMYAFVQSPNQEFIDSNIPWNAFEHLEVNAIIILDNNDNILYEGYYDYTAGQELELSDDEKNSIRSAVSYGKDVDSFSGLVSSGDQAFIVAGSKISDSEGVSLPAGEIIFAKFLLSEVSILESHVDRPVALEIGQDAVFDIYGIDSVIVDDDIFLRHTGDGNLEIILQIYSLDDSPAAIIHVLTLRDEYLRARDMFAYFIIILLILLACIAAGIYFLSDRFLLRRIKDMDSTLEAMIASKALDKKLSVSGNDEIANLALSFEKLTAIISEQEKSLVSKNDELESSNKTLKEFDSMKEQFLFIISAEIRSMLSIIDTHAANLRNSNVAMSSEQSGACQLITYSAAQINAFLDTFLSLGQFETGKLNIAFEIMNPNEVLSAILSRSTPFIVQNGGSVSFTKDDSCQAIRIYPKWFDQAADYLIYAALKCCVGQKPRIIVSTSNMGSGILIRVTYSNTHVQLSDIMNIFDPFFNCKTAPGTGNLGIWFSLVQRIVLAHNGTISAKLENVKDISFEITVPYVNASPTQQNSSPPTPVVSAPVVSAPVVSAPVVSAPVVSAPVVSAPVVSTPVASTPSPPVNSSPSV